MCLCTLIAANGNRVWSNDPAFVAAARIGTGHYRLAFTVSITQDVIVVQPRPDTDDVPRSLLAWPLPAGNLEIEVRVDAHFIDPGAGPHAHRHDVDSRFSVLRCARGNAE